MQSQIFKRIVVLNVFIFFLGMLGSVYGQIEPSIDENSTVIYPASFFDQYQPY